MFRASRQGISTAKLRASPGVSSGTCGRPFAGGAKRKIGPLTKSDLSVFPSLACRGANRGSGRLASSSAFAGKALIQLGSGSSRGRGGFRSRGGHRSAFDRNNGTTATTTAVAAAVAAIATVAATAAAAVTMAAAAPMAAMATTAAARARTAIAGGAAIAAIARRVAAVAAMAAAATEQAGIGLLLTAHEGDSNQREKDRDTQNNNTVHPRILQLLTGTSKRENFPSCLSSASPQQLNSEPTRCDLTFPARIRSLAPLSPCQALRITKDMAIAQVRPLR